MLLNLLDRLNHCVANKRASTGRRTEQGFVLGRGRIHATVVRIVTSSCNVMFLLLLLLLTTMMMVVMMVMVPYLVPIVQMIPPQRQQLLLLMVVKVIFVQVGYVGIFDYVKVFANVVACRGHLHNTMSTTGHCLFLLLVLWLSVMVIVVVTLAVIIHTMKTTAHDVVVVDVVVLFIGSLRLLLLLEGLRRI